ncbi:MAG: hypothetical protein KKE09_19495 [Bacteroidetes bacterium]|nr:hypothetical protein [Bacteroidota bacterium]
MKEWIGVDLDGTLAHYEEWNEGQHIGCPIMPMLERVKEWIEDGVIVKIFTARAADNKQIPHIEEWLHKHGLPCLAITNVKDKYMKELWDDRCVSVESNTGRIRVQKSSNSRTEITL